MKRNLLIVLVLVFCLNSYSQEFNEDYLVGEWVLSSESEIDELISDKYDQAYFCPEKIVLSDESIDTSNSPMYGYLSTTFSNFTLAYSVRDYHITHNNLHILSSNMSNNWGIIFQIESLTENQMILHSRSGKGLLIYNKEKNTSVNAVKQNSEKQKMADKAYYGLDGKRMDVDPTKGVYIHNRKKVMVK